jgi:hypothetical protein
MAAISGGRANDERVKCLRIFADANGETHMEDIDINLQPRKLFKDNPPLRLTDNLPASHCVTCRSPVNGQRRLHPNCVRRGFGFPRFLGRPLLH